MWVLIFKLFKLKAVKGLFGHPVFVPHAREIWTKAYGPNYTKLWAFDQKKKWLTIFDTALATFRKTFLELKQLFDAKLLIWWLPSFSVPKITVVRQV